MISKKSPKIKTTKTGSSDFVAFIYLDGQTQAVPAGRLNLIEKDDHILRSTFVGTDKTKNPP